MQKKIKKMMEKPTSKPDFIRPAQEKPTTRSDSIKPMQEKTKKENKNNTSDSFLDKYKIKIN